MKESETKTIRPHEGLISASSLGPLSKKQESIAEMLTQDDNLEKLTEVYKDEPLKLALAKDFFILVSKLKEAKTLEDFNPRPYEEILKDYLRFRISLNRMGRTELRDTAKIHIMTEEKQPEKRGLFGLLKR